MVTVLLVEDRRLVDGYRASLPSNIDLSIEDDPDSALEMLTREQMLFDILIIPVATRWQDEETFQCSAEATLRFLFELEKLELLPTRVLAVKDFRGEDASCFESLSLGACTFIVCQKSTILDNEALLKEYLQSP